MKFCIRKIINDELQVIKDDLIKIFIRFINFEMRYKIIQLFHKKIHLEKGHQQWTFPMRNEFELIEVIQWTCSKTRMNYSLFWEMKF